MRLVDYLKDKITSIFISFISIIIVELSLIIFNANIYLKIYIPIILFMSFSFVYIYNYYRKKNFYNNLLKSLNNLDKKYLITEVLGNPSFLEGQVLKNILYEIDKSMLENVNRYKYNEEEFKDYLQMWCHEIKTPISTSKLIIDNNQDEVTSDILEEIDKMEGYVEQVMYYSKSNTVEKDYIINKTNLEKVVQCVIKKNKKPILYKKIKIELDNLNINVNSDSKWLEFILNQVVINSIKYSKEKDAYIKISAEKNKNNVFLKIEDNGIGIKKEEQEKVFDKGFTGTNGRKKYNSTGIGLYLCKKLCDKLSHNITINSVEGKKTIVTIVFPNSSMTNLTEM